MVAIATQDACTELLRRVLGSAEEAPGPATAHSALVLVVEGAAGTGTSHLVARVRAARPAGTDVRSLAVGRPPDPANDADSAARWAQGIAGARTRPALAVVEDVHRADAATLAALRDLVRRLPPRTALVLTCRPGELPVPGVVLGEPLDPPPYVLLARHRVQPLDRHTVRDLAAQLLGAPCSQEAADLLHAVTGGVAQVVVDALTGLTDLTAFAPPSRPPGPLTVEDVWRLSPTVRLAETALSRTHAVPPEHRALVRAAAVLAPAHATEDELRAVAGLDAPAARAALLAALAARAVDEAPAPGRYGFTVPLAARAVAAAIPGPVRCDLHARAAHVLKQRAEIPWPDVAEHLRTAGRYRGRHRAVQRALAAHLRAGRPEAAGFLLRRALTDASVQPPDRVRLSLASLRDVVAALPPRSAGPLLDALIEDAALPAPIRGNASVLRALSLCTPTAPDRDHWLVLAHIATSLTAQPGLAARVMSGMAIPHWPGVRLGEHLHWLERAEATAADVPDPALHAAVAANRVSLLVTLQDRDAFRGLGLPDTGAAAGTPLPTGTGAPPPADDEPPAQAQHRLRGLCNAADASVWLGRYEDARSLLARARALAERLHAGPITGDVIRSTTLLLHWFTGDWAELTTRAERLAVECAHAPVLGDEARIALASLALARGEWPEAEAWLERGEGAAAGEELMPLSTVASTVRIRLALARDDRDGAYAEASAAWNRLRAKAIWAWAAEVAPWAVTAALGAGRVSAARQMARELAAGAVVPHSPLVVAADAWCRAALAEHRGDLAVAAALYRTSAARYRALPRPYAAVLATEAAAGCALAADPEDEAAVGELSDAAAQLAGLGAVWDAARIRARVRTVLPAPARRPGRPGYDDRLSPREQEVAELAGAGLTNRDIAATLCLSPRTVEHHVAHAMRKLAVSSRRQLRPPGGLSAAPQPQR